MTGKEIPDEFFKYYIEDFKESRLLLLFLSTLCVCVCVCVCVYVCIYVCVYVCVCVCVCVYV